MHISFLMKIKTGFQYLFVYGTLRKGFQLPINKQIAENVEWIGQAEIKGTLFDIGEYPGAKKNDIGEKSFIIGDIFKILDIKVLEILDEYEGLDPLKITESDYLRKQETIDFDGKEIEVWIYWYNKSTDNKFRIRHNDYLEYLKKKKTA